MPKAQGGGLVLFGRDMPEGVVVMWHGSRRDIPRGWRECNGQYGTPDLCTLSAQTGVTYIKRVK